MTEKELLISDLFPSRYIKTSDVGENDIILTIEGVNIEEIGNSNESKPIVSFKETPKVLVLNKTNGATLGRLYGPKVANWLGKKIALYTIEVVYQGTPILGIRIRPKPPLSRQSNDGDEPDLPDLPPEFWN